MENYISLLENGNTIINFVKYYTGKITGTQFVHNMYELIKKIDPVDLVPLMEYVFNNVPESSKNSTSAISSGSILSGLYMIEFDGEGEEDYNRRSRVTFFHICDEINEAKK